MSELKTTPPTLYMKIKITRCKKCQSSKTVKAGKINGNQRFKCKDCGCQFQPNRHHGRPEKTKSFAIILYLFGLSFRTIAKLTKTDLHAVYRWIREFAEEHYEKPEPKSKAVIVELDEMWHFIHSKKNSVGYGRLIIRRFQGSLSRPQFIAANGVRFLLPRYRSTYRLGVWRAR